MAQRKHFISLADKLTLNFLLTALLLTLITGLLLWMRLKTTDKKYYESIRQAEWELICHRMKTSLETLNNLQTNQPNTDFQSYKIIEIEVRGTPLRQLPDDWNNQAWWVLLSKQIDTLTFMRFDSTMHFTVVTPKTIQANYLPLFLVLYCDKNHKQFVETFPKKLETKELTTLKENTWVGDTPYVVTGYYLSPSSSDAWKAVLDYSWVAIFIVGLAFVHVYYYGRKIIQPLIEMIKAAEDTANKNYLKVKIPGAQDEIRTLAETFNQMALRLEKQNEELEKERNRRLRAILDSQELERKRVAKELHEGLAQELAGLRFMITRLHQAQNIGEIKKNLPALEELADSMIEQIRGLSNNLSPTVLSGYGLGAALRFLVEESARATGTDIELDVSGLPQRIGGKMKTYVYRIVQEALQNALNHSNATHIEISFQYDNSELDIFITDNGQGFPEFRLQNPGLGVYRMQERIEVLGGTLLIESEAGKGTKVNIRLPLKNTNLT
ncbi:MAG: HAMP domain-containing sensor histidine kinase [Bacteroidales bacterium]